MKDSRKLFLSALVLFIIGCIKGIAPTILNYNFDIGSFLFFSIISIVVVILGIIKQKQNK